MRRAGSFYGPDLPPFASERKMVQTTPMGLTTRIADEFKAGARADLAQLNRQIQAVRDRIAADQQSLSRLLGKREVVLSAVQKRRLAEADDADFDKILDDLFPPERGPGGVPRNLRVCEDAMDLRENHGN